MKRIRFLFILLILTLLPTSVFADSQEYLVLGSDLTAQEEQTVLDLLGVENKDDYVVSYVTNQEEHKYLDAYLPAEVIGSRALSSIVLSPNSNGIKIETNNINYVTTEMYQNALITAGIENVYMKVAGPTNISGTAALVAASKAYSIMTGEDINEENLEVANEELVTTQDLANEVGEKDASNLIAALKQEVVENNYSEEEIATALDELASKMNITINQETKNQIINLMINIESLNLDPNAIKQQAQNIYNEISVYLGDLNDSGFFDQIWQSIVNFFQSIGRFFS